MIQAKVIADSKNKFGNRITTLEVIIPRIVLAEFNTHRMFSRNSASSRAIPFKKMVETVKNNPFIPIAFQKDHKGMQGIEYITNEDRDGEKWCIEQWLHARDHALKEASTLNEFGKLTKQLCNRLLEPFMYHKVLVTATEWENFFELRCPQYGNEEKGYFRSKKDALKFLKNQGTNISNLSLEDTLGWLKVNKSQAEIHIQAAAEAIWDAMNESIPKELKENEWHIPYGDDFDTVELDNITLTHTIPTELVKRRISVARCARVSYTTLDTNAKHDYEKDLKLYERLKNNGHCFDEKTEILTNEGWKKIKNLNKKELIAAVNTKTGQFIGFEKPLSYIENNYAGLTYKYKSKNIDLYITSNHKLLGVPINKSKDRTKSYESLEVFEANRIRNSQRSKYKTFGEQELKMFSSPQKIIITEDINYLKGQLFGFFIGDGYKASKNTVKFRLKKLRKIAYIKKILTSLQISSNIRIDKNNVTNITFKDNGEFSKFYIGKNKTIPKYFLEENINTLYGLFDGLKNSDGSIKRNTWVYDTTSKQLCEMILTICPLVGLTANLNKSYLKNNQYRISFNTNSKIIVNDSRVKSSKVLIKEEKLKVYCVEIPSGGIIVRRNDKVVITHNSSPFEHVAKCMSEEEGIRFRHVTPNYKHILGEDIKYGICKNFKGFIQERYYLEQKFKK